MRTKKAKGPGRRSSLDDSAGEDSDGVGSDLDRLPDDSSSDDDVGLSAAQHASLAGGSAGLLGRGHAAGGALPYALIGDARALQHQQAHRGMPVGSAAGRAQPQGGRPHGPVPAAQLPGGAVNGGAPAAGASGAKATAGHGPSKAGAAGWRRSAGEKATRHAAVKEDATVRRIKAQVNILKALQWICEAN